MLSLSYLKSILKRNTQTGTGLTFLTDDSQFMESAAGYDGIIELIQKKGVQHVLILENNQVGEFSITPGGINSASQSLWIMSMVAANQDRNAVQKECFLRMEDIIRTMVGHEKDTELAEWEWKKIPYGARNAGPNFTGFEFTLYFTEYLNLSHGAVRTQL